MADHAEPLKQEVEEQLQRLLDSPRFKNAPSQSEFLALVVNRALQGKRTRGHVIGRALFGEEYDGKADTDVRATARNVRMSVDQYYAKEGAGELVVITFPKPPEDRSVSLPEGEAYTPRFSYNPAHETMGRYQMAEFFLHRGMYDDMVRAAELYMLVLSDLPHFADAALGMAELWCRMAYWDFGGPQNQSLRKDMVRRAAEFLDIAEQYGKNRWRLQAVGGFMLIVDGNLEQARIAFGKALQRDQAKTLEYHPYFFFLIKSGKPEEAARLAKRNVYLHLDSVGAHVSYARVLITLRLFEEADHWLKRANELSPGQWEVFFLHAITFSWLGKRLQTKNSLEMLRTLATPEVVTTTEELCKWIEQQRRARGSSGPER